jgi:hypothetical protein
MTGKLFALRIPSTWAVIYNSFGDEAPQIRDGLIVNHEFYDEDLLSIERVKFDGSAWRTDPDGHALDLGWMPPGSLTGSYRLTLLHGNWDNIVVSMTDTDARRICDAIEQCLELVGRGVPDDEVRRLMTKADPADQTPTT